MNRQAVQLVITGIATAITQPAFTSLANLISLGFWRVHENREKMMQNASSMRGKISWRSGFGMKMSLMYLLL